MNLKDENYKSGFVAVIGRPNVGKSTLINAYLGQKIAAVSPRPQMTRRRQLGILSLEKAQIIFIDTPGIHIPHHKLGHYMNENAESSLEDTDLILWVTDMSVSPQEEDLIIASKINALKTVPLIILAFNKIDLIEKDDILKRTDQYQSLLPNSPYLGISASDGTELDKLLDLIIEYLPQGSQLYDEDQITDFYEKEIAADLIRQSALFHLREEIPHALAVRIDEFKERSPEQAYISATLIVEKESHKGIVIGKNGAMIKKIGITARQEIESMSDRKTFLELRVKVNKNWRNDPSVLKRLGYQT